MKTILLRSGALKKHLRALALVCVLLINYFMLGRISSSMNYLEDGKDILVVNEVENNTVEVEGKVKKISETTHKSSKRKKTKNVVSSGTYAAPNVDTSYDSATGDNIANYAKKFVGLKYVYGGNSLVTGTDCSGFTKLIYKHFGYSLARGARSQLNNGTYVAKSDLKPGDLVFYSNGGSKPTHVAIYIGNGKIIHETKPGSGCKISSVNIMHYVTARRVIKGKTTNVSVANAQPVENTTTTIKQETTVVTTTSTTTTTTVTTTQASNPAGE